MEMFSFLVDMFSRIGTSSSKLVGFLILSSAFGMNLGTSWYLRSQGSYHVGLPECNIPFFSISSIPFRKFGGISSIYHIISCIYYV